MPLSNVNVSYQGRNARIAQVQSVFLRYLQIQHLLSITDLMPANSDTISSVLTSTKV